MSQRDAPSMDRSPILVLPDVPHQFFTTLELLQHWSPFQEPNAGVWPGKDGCAWTYWKSYTGVAVPSAWPRATSHRLPRDSRTCQWTRSSRNNRKRSSFDIIPPLLCALKSHIHVGHPGWIKPPLKLLLRPCHTWGHLSPRQGVTNDRDLPT